MENIAHDESEHFLAIVRRIILLLMIKEKRFQELSQLRQEPVIGEIIIESLKELVELSMIKVTGNKLFPFELTAKGDAATDISLFNGHAFYLRMTEIEQEFENWEKQMREKQKGG